MVTYVQMDTSPVLHQCPGLKEAIDKIRDLTIENIISRGDPTWTMDIALAYPGTNWSIGVENSPNRLHFKVQTGMSRDDCFVTIMDCHDPTRHITTIRVDFVDRMRVVNSKLDSRLSGQFHIQTIGDLSEVIHDYLKRSIGLGG